MNRRTLLPAASVLASAILFGTTGTVLVSAPDDADPGAVGALRLLVGATTLVAIAARRHRRDTPLPHPRTALMGALGVAVFQFGYFIGVERTGVAVGTVVTIGSGPLIGGVLHTVTTGRPPSRRWVIGSVTGVAGVAVLGLAGRPVAADPLGLVLAVAAGAGWATFATAGRTMIDRGVESTAAMAVMFAGGALASTPLLVGRPVGWIASAPGVLVVTYLGLVTVGLAYWLYGRALRALDAPVVITLTLLEPITAAVLARVVVGEEITFAGWTGVVAVLVGLVLAAPRSTRQE